MRRPGGYAVIFSPETMKANFDGFRCDMVNPGMYETDTFSCVHCNKIMHVRPMAPMDQFGSMCRNCMKMVCPRCADGPCVPFEKKLAEAERQQYIRQQYAMLG
jgi:hypothetical protein